MPVAVPEARANFAVSLSSEAEPAIDDMSGLVVLISVDGTVLAQVPTHGLDGARIASTPEGVVFTSDLNADYRISPQGEVSRLERPKEYQKSTTHRAVLTFGDGSAISVLNYGFDQAGSGSYRAYASIIPPEGSVVSYVSLQGYPMSAGVCSDQARIWLINPTDQSAPPVLVTLSPDGTRKDEELVTNLTPATEMACGSDGTLSFLGTAGSGTDPYSDPLLLVSLNKAGQLSTKKLIDSEDMGTVSLAQESRIMTDRVALRNGTIEWSYLDGSVMSTRVNNGTTKQVLDGLPNESGTSFLGALGKSGNLAAAVNEPEDSLNVTQRETESVSSLAVKLGKLESNWNVTDVTKIDQ
ncbi:MAG: hypothetical protein WKF57_12855 [Nakamurella sp.]